MGVPFYLTEGILLDSQVTNRTKLDYLVQSVAILGYNLFLKNRIYEISVGTKNVCVSDLPLCTLHQHEHSLTDLHHAGPLVCMLTRVSSWNTVFKFVAFLNIEASVTLSQLFQTLFKCHMCFINTLLAFHYWTFLVNCYLFCCLLFIYSTFNLIIGSLSSKRMQVSLSYFKWRILGILLQWGKANTLLNFSKP